MRYVAVGIGAVLGANLRFVVANWAAARWGPDFPYGTFIINITGAFAIGVVLSFLTARVAIDPVWRLFAVTGFLGGYTTFSSYAWEALVLVQDGAFLRFGAYVIGSNVLGLLGVWLGAGLGAAIP